MNGLDFAAGPANPASLRAAGIGFVCRYLSSTWKGIRSPEYEAYVHAGIGVVLNYENTGQESLGGFQAGVKYARIGEQNRVNAGIPVAPVYFSVDFQPTRAQMSVILEYLRGVASVIGHDRTGVYGSYDVIEAVHKSGAAAWFWQTYAWSAGRVSTHAHIYQHLNGQHVAGVEADLDRALSANYGQTAPPDSPTSVATPTPISTPAAPEEEDDTMAQNSGIYWDVNAKTVSYAVVNPESGYWQAFGNGAGNGPLPADYVNGVAAAFHTGSFAKVTAGHAAAIQASCKDVLDRKLTGTVTTVTA